MRNVAGILTLLVVLAAGTVATRSAKSAEDKPKVGKPVAPEAISMVWHDRAYGQLKLAILKKKKTRGVEHAWLLAELSHVGQGQREDDKYRAFSASLSKLAAEAVPMLEAENWDAARAQLKKMDAQCTACHEQFRG